MSSSKGNNFLTNPGGNGGGTKPRDFTAHRTTRSAPDASFNEGSVPAGGIYPNAEPKPDAGNPLGSTKPPMRVS